MKSLQQNLKRIRDALNTTSAAGRITHYFRPANMASPWIVWQESDESTSFDSNNHKTYQQVSGTIDCYTLIEYNPLLDEIQEALDMAGIGFRLSMVQYEDDTKLIHYTWEFNLA